MYKKINDGEALSGTDCAQAILELPFLIGATTALPFIKLVADKLQTARLLATPNPFQPLDDAFAHLKQQARTKTSSAQDLALVHAAMESIGSSSLLEFFHSQLSQLQQHTKLYSNLTEQQKLQLVQFDKAVNIRLQFDNWRKNRGNHSNYVPFLTRQNHTILLAIQKIGTSSAREINGNLNLKFGQKLPEGTLTDALTTLVRCRLLQKHKNKYRCLEEEAPLINAMTDLYTKLPDYIDLKLTEKEILLIQSVATLPGYQLRHWDIFTNRRIGTSLQKMEECGLLDTIGTDYVLAKTGRSFLRKKDVSAVIHNCPPVKKILLNLMDGRKKMSDLIHVDLKLDVKLKDRYIRSILVICEQLGTVKIDKHTYSLTTAGRCLLKKSNEVVPIINPQFIKFLQQFRAMTLKFNDVQDLYRTHFNESKGISSTRQYLAALRILKFLVKEYEGYHYNPSKHGKLVATFYDDFLANRDLSLNPVVKVTRQLPLPSTVEFTVITLIRARTQLSRQELVKEGGVYGTILARLVKKCLLVIDENKNYRLSPAANRSYPELAALSKAIRLDNIPSEKAIAVLSLIKKLTVENIQKANNEWISLNAIAKLAEKEQLYTRKPDEIKRMKSILGKLVANQRVKHCTSNTEGNLYQLGDLMEHFLTCYFAYKEKFFRNN